MILLLLLVLFWVLLKLTEFNEGHCELFTIITIHWGLVGSSVSTQVETMALSHTESNSSRGSSLGAGKAPTFSRP